MKKMNYADYLDKVYGGWFGKCLGGAAGAPVEGIKAMLDVEMREILDPNLPNDDLDLQLLWLEVIEKKGPGISSRDLADAWDRQCWYPFGEYGYFLKNYELGIYPPLSGEHNNRYFNNGMGCPIRSEIWAMIYPGYPEKAVEMAKIDASLDHTDNSYWAEVFLSALEALAFYEDHIPKLIKEAMTYVEEDCLFLSCIQMVYRSWEEGLSFEKIVRKIQMDYSHPDFTNSVQNLGYTVLALLFGEGDLELTINKALKCGFDADCTCATAGAIVGIVKGYTVLPDDLKALLQDKYVIGIDVTRRDDSIYSLAEDTCRAGISVLAHEGLSVIENLPEDLTRLEWSSVDPWLEIDVDYAEKRPAIGFDDSCQVILTLSNKTEEEYSGLLSLEGLPEGWSLSVSDFAGSLPLNLTLKASEKKTLTLLVSTSSDLDRIEQQNIFKGVFTRTDDGRKADFDFGIAGGLLWHVHGPFIEPREFTPDPSHPPCHGNSDSTLPCIETIFSNMADPAKEYIDEADYVDSPDSFEIERSFNSYEDLLPLDENFGLHGEAVFYLFTDIYIPKARKTWLVVGNTDAFKLWLNGETIMDFDECRYWQPHSHGEIVDLKEGQNRLVLKLTRRTGPLAFSLALRGDEKKHYHHQRWLTDFAGLNLTGDNKIKN